MITTKAEVCCDGCSEVIEVEMTDYSSSIPMFGVDNDIEGLEDWEIDDNQQLCPKCK